MNTYTKRRQAIVEKTLLLIAEENHWQTKQVIREHGVTRVIYKIPANG